MVKQLFTISELEDLINNFRIVFDYVNLIDISDMTIKEIADGKIGDREGRGLSLITDDHISFSASELSMLSKKSRLETIDDKIYMITALSADVIDEKRNISSYVIEFIMDMSGDYKRKTSVIPEFKEVYIENYVDELTQVYNYEYFDSKEYAKIMKDDGKYKFTYIIADIHRFRKIIDNYGDFIANEVLVETARTLVNNLRATDKVVRLKNERFLIILKNTNEEFIKSKIEYLRNKIKGHVYDSENGYFPILTFGYKIIDSDYFDEELERQALAEAEEMLDNEKMFS